MSVKEDSHTLFGFFENWKERKETREIDPYLVGLTPQQQGVLKEVV